MTPEITLEPPSLRAQPGTPASIEVRIRNGGVVARELVLGISGPAAAWASVFPPALTLEPGAEGAAKLTFRIPRGPEPAAGTLPFSVTAAPGDGPAGAVEAAGSLEIAPFVDIFARIAPRTSTARRSAEHTVTVENRGNAPARVALSADGAGDDLQVRIDPPEVTPGPGATADSAVRVAARRRRLRGEQAHAFRVKADTEGAPAAGVDASMTQIPLPGWIPAVAVLLALAIAGGALRATVLSPDRSAKAGKAARSESCVAAGHISPAASGRPRTPVPTPFNYSFLFVDSGGCNPVRFNPCEPIHYVLNPTFAPAGGVADVHEAFRKLAAATEMQFVFDGTTDEVSGPNRRPYLPERYGSRWAPILLIWVHLGGTSQDDILVAGRGRPFVQRGVIVSGILELNVDAVIDKDTRAPVPDGFGAGITWGRVIMHELGHIVGLGHVESPAQLMHDELTEQTSRTAEYGLGDVTGLRLVGRRAGCLPAPPLPG